MITEMALFLQTPHDPNAKDREPSLIGTAKAIAKITKAHRVTNPFTLNDKLILCIAIWVDLAEIPRDNRVNTARSLKARAKAGLPSFYRLEATVYQEGDGEKLDFSEVND